MGRAGRLALVITIIAGVVIALMIMATRSAAASDDVDLTVTVPDPSVPLEASPDPEASLRLVAPAHEFALTVPASWEMRTLEPDGEPLSSQSLVRRDEMVYAAKPLPEGGGVLCVIHVYSTEDASPAALGTEVSGVVRDLQRVPENEVTTPVAEVVELAPGPALRVDLDQDSPTPSLPDGTARVRSYYLVRDDELYVTGCRRSPGMDDSWLSIAESFEFLPAGE
jgi:hypothetical protein